MLSHNLKIHQNMTFDWFYTALKECRYHGFDLTLLVLMRMLKVVIGVLHPEYIWLSNLDVNVQDANVFLVLGQDEQFTATGQ